MPDQLPSFESVVERVTNIEQNRSFYYSTRSRYSNVEPAATTTPTTTTTTSSKDTPNSTMTMNTTQPACPPRSASFCTNCCQTGHTLEMCFKPGGGQHGGLTDRNKTSACVYLADVDVDTNLNGGATAPDQPPPSLPDVVDEELPTSFAALGSTSFVPSTSTLPMNNDIYFDLYQPGVISTAFSSLADLSPACFSSISTLFNSILDSGCTHHIIWDRSLFWTYHVSQAIPVKTANCGTLKTLAKGDVKMRLQCGSQSIVLTFRDCSLSSHQPYIRWCDAGVANAHSVQ